MFRKFALLGILTFLAGCETFSGMQRDIDKLADMVDIPSIDGDFLEWPEGKATKAPEPLPSTINMQTGIVIQSEQDKADAAATKAKKATSKPLSAEKPAPPKKKIVKTATVKKPSAKTVTSVKKAAPKKRAAPVQAANIQHNIKKNPICIADNLKISETISQLYAFYYKKPKPCKAQDYHDRAVDVYRLVLTGKDHQDARLMNADHGFATFILDIMHYAPVTVRKNAATLLRAKGCGLINKDQCINIINKSN